jgi:signal transduction histidine kinase
MVIALLVLSGLLLSALLILQVRSYRKLKLQTRLMFLQGQEIKKQVLKLQQQNSQLEKLNHEKQIIISIVSHDFKGPFNRIFALAQLLSLSGDNLTDEQQDYLGKIHQIVADGLIMLRNLLDNRRLEEKGIELVPEVLNVPAVIASMVKNYLVVAAKKKIQIILEGPPRVLLMTDKTCLTRIADNLLSNAIKFSPPQKQIVVSVWEKGDIVEISVKDEGPGIAEADRGKLFQKYQKLTARPTGGESSTGLGLYLIKAMVNKMKSEILCVSEGGQGATFTVRLRALTNG